MGMVFVTKHVVSYCRRKVELLLKKSKAMLYFLFIFYSNGQLYISNKTEHFGFKVGVQCRFQKKTGLW